MCFGNRKRSSISDASGESTSFLVQRMCLVVLIAVLLGTDMATIPEENGTKPLLEGHEGTSYDEEHGDWVGGKEKSSRTSCSPSTTKLELLESFDDGPVGVLQSDAQTILNIVISIS